MSSGRRRRGVRLGLALAGLAAAACGGAAPPPDLALRRDVEARRFTVGAPAAGLAFAATPRLRSLVFDDERRAAVVTGLDGWSWTGRLPAAARLVGGVQADGPGEGAELRVEVAAVAAGRRTVLKELRLGPRRAARWLDFGVDLTSFAGREVRLEGRAAAAGPGAAASGVAWAPLRVVAPPRRRSGPPNVLLIVVDTLRADHLTPYGYGRDTCPNLERWLARAGVVVEEARAQAPWTLPSAVSYLSGRHPGELLGEDPATYALPPDVPTVAELLQRAGYETAAFIANKTLHDGVGVGRGFATFYAPPLALETGRPDARWLNERVRRWLRSRAADPFFLYVHYIDPHDPYENPEIAGGRSRFYPDYPGRLTGRDVHTVYAGALELERPREDRAHFAALYDEEIRYADRYLGKLLALLPEAVLADTLVVFTADHGEEFYEHGGWKHGFTLYDEQLHVPLVVRWDGRLPRGGRLRGPVALLDLVPTVLAAAGVDPPPDLPGVDLLPALAGRAPLPDRAVLAQHLMIGPLRASAVAGQTKLVLFNPRTPFAPGNALEEHLWRLDLARLERVELYDLAADPGERRNLAAAAGERVHELEPAIHRQLDRQLHGLRVVAAGLPPGSVLRATITFARPPEGWRSYFLGSGDSVELDGATLRLALFGGDVQKGILVDGDEPLPTAVAATLDGRPLAAAAVRVGDGRPWAAGTTAAALRSSGWPAPPPGPSLRLWSTTGSRRQPPVGDPETARRLRALGYLQ